ATGAGASFTFTPDDNGSYRIVLTASDEDGGSASTEQTITVGNVAPSAALSGPSSGVRGQTLSYTGAFTDPGAADTHTLAWTVTRGGVVAAAGGGAAFSFVPTESGDYVVAFTVTDDDGGSGTAAQTVSVGAAAVQGGDLVIGGTTGRDIIVVSPSATA